MSFVGGCLCGRVRYEVDRKPRIAAHCHCLHCRRSSGAAFLTWIGSRSAEFRVTSGEPRSYISRPGVTRRFCGDCGTQLAYEDEAEGGVVYLTACSLDEPDEIQPRDHIWADRTLPWARLDDGLPRHGLERLPE